jgi:hypothetical protein
MGTRLQTLVVVAAAAAGGGALSAQPELELRATTDAQIQLVDEIHRLRAEGGPAAESTIDPLRALALLQQEAGDDVLAIAVLEQARYVTRVRRGLASADEALLLQMQIRSEKALGLHEQVWDLEQDMLTIARQHHDDIRMVPIFRELADDRAEVLREYRAGNLPPEISLGCYYGAPRPRYDDPRPERGPETRAYIVHEPRSCRSGSRSGVINRLVWEILMHYADAIEVILESGDYASEELRDLERRAFRLAPFRSPYLALPTVGNMETSSSAPYGKVIRCPGETLRELLAPEILGTCLEPVVHADGVVIANVGGWASLVRLIAYEIRSGASAGALANAVTELADWHLLSVPAERRQFNNSTEVARELYERAYRRLQQDGDVQASTRIFAPELPVTVPTFAPNPFGAASTGSSRYIDVSFVVTKHGRGERVEVTGASENATRGDERDLIRLIESTSFRPRFVDDELADAAPVALRYVLGP